MIEDNMKNIVQKSNKWYIDKIIAFIHNKCNNIKINNELLASSIEELKLYIGKRAILEILKNKKIITKTSFRSKQVNHNKALSKKQIYMMRIRKFRTMLSEYKKTIRKTYNYRSIYKYISTNNKQLTNKSFASYLKTL